MLHDLHTSITLINASMQELNKEKDLSEKGRYYLNLAMKLSEYLFHTDSLNPEISDNENQSFVGGTEQLGDSFIEKATEVVRNNMLNVGFDKELFAIAMNVSPSLLYKKMKALTGQSPSDFVKTMRLNHAAGLLQSHLYTVTEVSELCGYSSISYFSSVFKKYFGKSPTEM